MKKIELDENIKRAIGDFYSTPHSLAETAAHFKLKSQPVVKRALADLRIQLHDKTLTVSMQQRKAKKTFRARYGCDYAISSETSQGKGKSVLYSEIRR